MKLISKILEQTDYDRYLFLTFENDEIVGLNFHQGIGDPLDYYFATPCPHLTEIYRRLTYQNDKYKNKNWDRDFHDTKTLSCISRLRSP